MIRSSSNTKQGWRACAGGSTGAPVAPPGPPRAAPLTTPLAAMLAHSRQVAAAPAPCLPEGGAGSPAVDVASQLRPLRPSPSLLGLPIRCPSCRSRQASLLDLPPRLRVAVALAAAAVLRPQILSPSQPFVRHSRRDGITSVVLARQEFAARQERPPSRGAAPKEFNGALSVRHSRAEMATDMNANINIDGYRRRCRCCCRCLLSFLLFFRREP